jgi:histidyl-tRNA synthetase
VAYKLIRGMRDVVGDDAMRSRHVEEVIISVVKSYGYEEIRLPLLESTELFSRGVGEATDIVEKEMYSFEDRNGKSLSLRPEGTASCVRACIEKGLIFNQTQRLWYEGPMFRYERPQRGRYRQFQQIGGEIFGISGSAADAELIQMASVMWAQLGIEREVSLEINTIGSSTARTRYRSALVKYLEPYATELDRDSQRRLETNPLRILDSKSRKTQHILEDAPTIEDHLDGEAREHFSGLESLLSEMELPYSVNPRLVRGLDYYTDTVFEWVTGSIGAQGVVCAGGRYDGLVERLGGRPTPAAGFAIGMDRVVLACEAVQAKARDEIQYSPVDVYCAVLEAQFMGWMLKVAQRLRDDVPGLGVRVDTGGGKLGNQLKRADESGARWALIVGEDEVAQNCITVKWLRTDRGQRTVAIDSLASILDESPE